MVSTISRSKRLSRTLSLALMLSAATVACGSDREEGAGFDADALQRGEGAGLSATGESLWVVERSGGTYEIDPRSGKVLSESTIDESPVNLVAAGGKLWITDFTLGGSQVDHLHYFAPGQTEVKHLDFKEDEAFPKDIVYGHGSLWVADGKYDQVYRVEPSSGKVEASIPLDQYDGLRQNDGKVLAVGNDAVYVGSLFGDDDVARIDLKTLAVTKADSDADGLSGLAASDDALWVTSHFDDMLRRLNLDTLAVEAELDPDMGVGGVVVAAGYVWVLESTLDGAESVRVLKVDPETTRVVGEVVVPTPFLHELKAFGAELWAADRDAGKLFRIDVETLKADLVAEGLGEITGLSPMF